MYLWHIAVICAAAIACRARKHYDGFQVLSINIDSPNQLKLLQSVMHDEEFDFWSEPRRMGSFAEVMVSPESRVRLTTFLRKNNIQYSTIVEDVEKNVERETERLNSRRDSAGKMSYDFNDYNDFDAMMQQLEYFAGNCSAPLSCSLYSIGNSFEGRPQTVLNMLTNYTVDSDVTYLLDTYNFYFLPVMNPDGYVFTWETDRFWRKSRNVNEGNECMGTDLNRNFDYSWGTDGASTDPCSDKYGGSSAASEPETQNIQSAADDLGPKLDGFISIHTAANMWLHPLGNTANDSNECVRSDDHEDQYQVAEAAALATMAEYDTEWTYGTICETIYPASGTTCDYAYGGAGIKYAFTPELRGPGADPPPEEIDPGWRELWAGIKALIAEVEAIEYA